MSENERECARARATTLGDSGGDGGGNNGRLIFSRPNARNIFSANRRRPALFFALRLNSELLQTHKMPVEKIAFCSSSRLGIIESVGRRRTGKFSTSAGSGAIPQ